MTDGSDILPNPHDRDPSQEELADMYGRLADYAAGSHIPDEHCEHDNAVASPSHQISIHTTSGSGRRPIPGDESAALQLGESHYWLVQNGPSPQIVSESHTLAGTLIPTRESRLDDPVARAGGSSIVSFDVTAKQLKDGYAPFVSFTWTTLEASGVRRQHTCTIQLNAKSGVYTLRRPEQTHTEQAPLDDARTILMELEQQGVLIRPQALAELHLPKHRHR